MTFRVAAPDAQKVRVRLGQGFDMSKGPDGLWYVTTTPQVEGFHYYTLSIDGAVTGARMVGVTVRDHGLVDRLRRVDIETAQLAEHADGRGHENVFRAHGLEIGTGALAPNPSRTARG